MTKPAALSTAERDVARLVVAGWTNAQIAVARGSAARTVANQVASIFRKLGVDRRAELAALFAMEPRGPRRANAAR